MGKTLIVYYAVNEKVRTAFESARRQGKVDVLELRERFDRTPLEAATLGLCQALSGTASKIDPLQVDLSAYETILLATPVWGGHPAPAVNAFLYQTNLEGREISAILVTRTGRCRECAKTLRRRIYSAGGICRDILTVHQKDLNVASCNVCEMAVRGTRLA